jgi:DNA replication protein DnaC
MTSTIDPATLLHCARCDELFDANGKPVDLGDQLLGDRDVYGFVCEACKPGDLYPRRLKASGLPARLQDAELRGSDTGHAADAARRFGAGDLDGVLLFGPVGVGKTHLAACATLARLQLEPVRWISVPGLIARATAAFDSDERQTAVMDLTGNGAVVLDDLDKVKASEWVLAQIFVAIDNRVTEGSGLFVTTNLGPNELKAKLGEAVVSRLMGHCEVCELDGTDRRLQR